MYSKSTRHNDFLKIISKTPVDQTEGKEPKKREDYYRRTLKAYSPFGLNVEDSVLPAPFNLKWVYWFLLLRIRSGVLNRQRPFKE